MKNENAAAKERRLIDKKFSDIKNVTEKKLKFVGNIKKHSFFNFFNIFNLEQNFQSHFSFSLKKLHIFGTSLQGNIVKKINKKFNTSE